jgi:hypothetical protein
MKPTAPEPRRSVIKGGRVNAMSKIEEIKAEVERLPSEEARPFRQWLTEKDWGSNRAGR